MKPETSQVWRKVFAALRSEGLGVQGLADKLLIPADEIVKLVFGLVTIGLPGTDTKLSGQNRGPPLTVIK